MKSSLFSPNASILLFFGLSSLTSSIDPSSCYHNSIYHPSPLYSINHPNAKKSTNNKLSETITFLPRGGAQPKPKKTDEAYNQLASTLLPRLHLLLTESSSSKKTKPIEEKDIIQALKSLASAQSTLKRIDGAAHEAYQRTHKEEEDMEKADSSSSSSSSSTAMEGVTGRAARSASRAGCAADALLAAELCELLEVPSLLLEEKRKEKDKEGEEEEEEEEGTLAGREIVQNITITLPPSSSSSSSTTTSFHNIDPPTIHILVLYEPNYNGQAGINHGGIDEILRSPSTTTSTSSSSPSSSSSSSRGRFLIILRDNYSTQLSSTLKCLDEEPKMLELNAGLVANEIASVNGMLWELAGLVLVHVWDVLQQRRHEDGVVVLKEGTGGEEEEKEEGGGDDNDDDEAKETPTTLPAIHFVGRSLAGGIAALSASILDGTLPMPDDEVLGIARDWDNDNDDDQSSTGGKSGRRRSKRRSRSSSRSSSRSRRHEGTSRKSSSQDKNKSDDKPKNKETKEKIQQPASSLSGYGRGRSSAVALGPPPCLSSNVKATFITSVIHGDDVICRTTKDSLDKLCKRTQRAIKGGVLGRRVGWMGDALSLTVSSLKSHAHGSEGEEARLSIPGKAYLVRPRRLGGASSMHEVGASGSGSGGSGREALRAAVLWQLNDVLLSRSMWVHHELESYINGLDRVLLRGFVEDEQKHNEERWD